MQGKGKNKGRGHNIGHSVGWVEQSETQQLIGVGFRSSTQPTGNSHGLNYDQGQNKEEMLMKIACSAEKIQKIKHKGGIMDINPFFFVFSALGKFIYALMGWAYDPLPAYWEPRCVVIGFPHTTNMDTVRALTYIKLAGINAKLLIKSKWFFFPMSIFLKSLGGLPVKRDKSCGFVDSVIKQYEENEELVVALVPEGTRKSVSTIKTGFWYIAKGADVPIICWYLDNRSKKTRWLGKIHPGESLEQDLLKIRTIYKRAGFSIPSKTKNR